MKLRDIVAEMNIEGESGAIGDIMVDLDTEDRELLDKMLYTVISETPKVKYKYTGRDVSRALNGLGYNISERTVQRYRQDKRESK